MTIVDQPVAHRTGCRCPVCFNAPAVATKPAEPVSAADHLARQLRHVKLLLAGVLVAILLVGAGAFVLTRPEPDWSAVKCFKESMSGSIYTRADLIEHGCFD